MSVTQRRRGPGAGEQALIWVAVGALLLLIIGTNLPERLTRGGLPGGLNGWYTVTFGVLHLPGAAPVPWDITQTLAAALLALLLLFPTGGYLYWKTHRTSHKQRIDAATPYMAGPKEIAPRTKAGVTKDAKRLGVISQHPGLTIGDTVPTGVRLYLGPEDTRIDVWGPRTGKAIEASTPVLTPYGWVPIKDLVRGNQVIGADGRPTTVTGVYPQGIRKAYRVHFSDRTSILCDGDHLWTVRPKIRADKKHPLAWRIWTTRQLMNNGLRWESGGARYYLPIVEPVQFEGILPEGEPTPVLKTPTERAEWNATLNARPLDPYLLGVLLGDGALSTGSITVTTGEPDDLLPLLRPLLPAGIEFRKVGGHDYDWRLSRTIGTRSNAVLDAVRVLGLRGHTSLTKFIPAAYLLADVATRQALLAGLMDTDGSIDERGIMEFSTSSPQLSDDFRFLVQSLGGTVTTTRRETDCAPSYRSMVRLPAAGPAPFRLPRKRDRWEQYAPQRRCELPVRTIVAIEPEGEADMVCISVSASNGLFVTDHCIVTHNSTSCAIPSILESDGPVVATSNRRDLTDATRDIRAEIGTVWIFDPQGITGEDATWWWNPLDYVLSGPDGSEVKSQRLAAIFATASAPPGTRGDRFFDPKGQNLLAHLLHAAALDGRDMTHVYQWVTNEKDQTPVQILEDFGHIAGAQALLAIQGSPEKQRGGVYGTAEASISFMTNTSAMTWITADPSRPRRGQFNPAEFAAGRVDAAGDSEWDTLYLLSREGQGSLAPLTTALTAAVCEAAEYRASRSPKGRLAVPMTVCLDEAANVCRWPSLPDLYSHYGGRGIRLITILQSWAQGVEVWGEHGMTKMWSASTVRVFGGGVAEVKFLGDMAQLIGSYRPQTTSSSTGKGGRTVSRGETEERVVEVSDLYSLPRGRAIVFASGGRPVLIATRPWQARKEWKAKVEASILAHDPAARAALGTVHRTAGTPAPGSTITYESAPSSTVPYESTYAALPVPEPGEYEVSTPDDIASRWTTT